MVDGFVKAFKAFGKVVEACFSFRLDKNYKEVIRSFRTAYLELGINVTPKVHIIFRHLEEFFEVSKGRSGLGLFSEQHFESVHHDYARIWARFKVPRGHPKYAERLQKALITYNSLHQSIS